MGRVELGRLCVRTCLSFDIWWIGKGRGGGGGGGGGEGGGKRLDSIVLNGIEEDWMGRVGAGLSWDEMGWDGMGRHGTAWIGCV